MAKHTKLGGVLKTDSRKWKSKKRTMLDSIGDIAVKEFTLNFRRQGFKDSTVKKWTPRKGEKRRTKSTKRSAPESRGILIGKGSGKKLSRSIKKLRVSKSRVVVGSTVKYAAVHNYGLRAGRGKGFKMKQRKFIGDSNNLDLKIKKYIRKKLKSI
jgi:phage gpG-like protein